MGDSKRRQAKKRVTEATGELAKGRRHSENSAWADAFRSLSLADKEATTEC